MIRFGGEHVYMTCVSKKPLPLICMIHNNTWRYCRANCNSSKSLRILPIHNSYILHCKLNALLPKIGTASEAALNLQWFTVSRTARYLLDDPP